MIGAIVLARGGSKGIPHKNAMLVGGEALVTRTTRILSESNVEKVFLWTDSKEISSLAYNHEKVISTLERPEETARDDSSSEDSIYSFLRLHDKERLFDPILLVQCTTPFLEAGDVNAVIEKWRIGKYDSVVTAVDMSHRFFGYPHHDGKADFIPMRPYRALRQEGSMKFWMENGGVYLATRSLWLERRRIGRRCGVVEMPLWRSIEIDDPEDLAVSQLLSGDFALCDIHEGEVEEVPPKPPEIRTSVRFIPHE